MNSENPYASLGERAFWAPAVGRRHMLDVSGLWSARFEIVPSTQIATFGSCFAQHFGRALTARGFAWTEAEPAPGGLSAETARRFGYGAFSARTGNIYTTSLLLQWIDWALGHRVPPELYWEAEGRVFDPFRPAIEPHGFDGVDEMLTSREGTIAAFGRALRTCEVFVFTMGLTESWRDADLDIEYPICPGTVAGTYDPARHIFVNQDYEAVKEHLEAAIGRIRASREVSPAFLLTVSPVPLTATASENHVLVATMESKSVLRAVAGRVARTDPDVDYFPSYEIINSPACRGAFFEPNMRSVSPHGVAHVMETFFRGIGQEEAPERSASTAAAARPELASAHSGDIACEEELLAVFGEDAR